MDEYTQNRLNQKRGKKGNKHPRRRYMHSNIPQKNKVLFDAKPLQSMNIGDIAVNPHYIQQSHHNVSEVIIKVHALSYNLRTNSCVIKIENANILSQNIQSDPPSIIFSMPLNKLHKTSQTQLLHENEIDVMLNEIHQSEKEIISSNNYRHNYSNNDISSNRMYNPDYSRSNINNNNNAVYIPPSQSYSPHSTAYSSTPSISQTKHHIINSKSKNNIYINNDTKSYSKYGNSSTIQNKKFVKIERMRANAVNQGVDMNHHINHNINNNDRRSYSHYGDITATQNINKTAKLEKKRSNTISDINVIKHDRSSYKSIKSERRESNGSTLSERFDILNKISSVSSDQYDDKKNKHKKHKKHKKKRKKSIKVIDNYICNDMYFHHNIFFDKYSLQQSSNYNCSNNKHLLLSCKPLTSGPHEWSLTILKSEGSAQEIGVVSNPNIDNIVVRDKGIIQTPEFGARAVYGNYLESIYYASYNDDYTQRCYKDLSQQCWAKGDVIKICLDLNKYRISFYLNGKKVRKKISIQTNKTYYPIISFVGDFKYKVN